MTHATRRPRLQRFVLPLASLAAGILVVAGPGVRLGLWSFQTGLLILIGAACIGAGSAIAAFLGLLSARIRRNGSWRLATAVLLGTTVFAIPSWQMHQARQLPPIHDISTDTANPPAFVALLPLRTSAANSAEYGGDAVAAQQRGAYPDIVPLHLAMTPPAAFDAALNAARAMGWDMIDAQPEQGRIEATSTTLWFGFKDDVVIRLRPDGDGTRIDVRSLSRVGRSDVGTNAKRIRTYLERLRKMR